MFDDILEGTRCDRVGQIEAVDVGLSDPLLQLVGDLFSRTDHERSEAADGTETGDIAHLPFAAVLVGSLEVRDRRLDGIALYIADRLVEVVLREVDSHPARHKDERALFTRVLQVVLVFRSREVRRRVGDNREEGVYLCRIAVATGSFERVADAPHRRLEACLGRRCDKDRLGVARCKRDTARACSGLVDHRRSLR